jgi:MFS family permease
LIATVFFAICIPLSAKFSDQRGRTAGLLIGTVGIICLGLLLGPMLQAGSVSTVIVLSVGMALMGASFGPLGALMSSLFPVEVRYTGASLAFNLAGILGASGAPYIAIWLATHYGLPFVGYYLSGMAMISLLALLLVRRMPAS